jgi:hypothetical protein
VEPRRLGHESDRAAQGRACRHVLGPDQVRSLTGHGHPAARITHDLNQQSLNRREDNRSRTIKSEYLPLASFR